MTGTIVVVRPKPGNAATVRRIEQAGLRARALPLFAIRPLDWVLPGEIADYDGLLLTSANTIRFAGARLDRLRAIPAFAVGAATAEAARAAGFDIVATGDADAQALIELASRQGHTRLLHLGGRDRSVAVCGPIAAAVAVYASNAVDVPASTLQSIENDVVLLHSARAAQRLAELIDASGIPRGQIALAAISDTVAAAAGEGWAARAIATAPRDDALITAARTLID